MKALVKIDTTAFNAATRDLARIAGKDFHKVLKENTGKVLERCVRDTRSAKPSAYPRGTVGFAQDGESQVWITAGLKQGHPAGQVWLRETSLKTGQKQTYKIAGPGTSWRWSKERFKRGQRLQKLAEADAKATARQIENKGKEALKVLGRGLSKQSWVQIADELGIAMKVPGFIRKAKTQKHGPIVNGRGSKHSSSSGLFYEIANKIPTLQGGGRKQDGRAILNGALAARAKAFETEVRKKLFDDAKARAARYPGLFVKP